MRRQKQNLIVEKVHIHDAGTEGKGVGRHEGLVVFVPYTAPGDVVDVEIFQRKKSFAEGKVIKFHEKSARRAEPFCPHFGLCGGCKWQHLDYELQLEFKEKMVKDNFERIGWIKSDEFRPIIGSSRTTFYRNKLEYTFSKRRWFDVPPPAESAELHDSRALGFHVPGMFDRVININECSLQADPSNNIRNEAAALARKMGLEFYDTRLHQGFLRNLIIRTTIDGQVMVILIVGRDEPDSLIPYMEALSAAVPEISSFYYAINSKQNDAIYDLEMILFRGHEYLLETLDGLTFRIGPKSFFQTNAVQAEQLYQAAMNLAALNGSEVVYDLYCGTGTIACFLARNAGKVVGIETIEAAVLDARENARANNLENVEFITADLGRKFDAGILQKYGKPDLVITDPPRAGMQPRVLDMLLDLEADRIVYVSCNPATQARDCSILDKKYDVKVIQPVDMFPHTQHVESVALLVRRPEEQ
jgi:23S rRNA (uracil1939-C5)-methyltransferase